MAVFFYCHKISILNLSYKIFISNVLQNGRFHAIINHIISKGRYLWYGKDKKKRRENMRLSKKQEKAIETALYVLSTALGNGLSKEEEKEFGEAVTELTKMINKSMLTKAKTKAKKEYLKKLLENSNTITLDGDWYDKNVRSKT